MRRASFGTQWVCLLFIAAMVGFCPSLLAVPAPKKLVQITQPDGSKLTVMKKGDEFFHYAVSSDGYTLRTDSSGFYRYAVRNEKGDLIPGSHVAADPASRNVDALRFLSTIEPGMRFSEQQRAQAIDRRIEQASPSVKRAPALRSTSASALSNLLINDFPLTGAVRSLVILVSFKDNNFSTPQPNTAFTNFLNQEGYNVGDHIGSVRDYYAFNSNGSFTPEFVVAGPVKLANTMAYYGANVNDRDVRPREMVEEACRTIDNTIDFSQFDNNGDGVVDNVYIFYAGKGEADDGNDDNPNSIWPHSWALAANSLVLDGKSIENYACSAELNGSGAMTGIGVFTHEFGHVIGLPDFYDTDIDENGLGFDPDAWSLMAYGSYNGPNQNGHVPPCLTVIERYLLGWTVPTPLTVPATPSLSPWVSSNEAMIINTSNNREFFLLENRQQLPGTWDEYIPHHGMLVYHIDARNNASTSIFRPGESKTYSFTFEKLWPYNLVNAIKDHQCADIEEADNSRIEFNGSNYAAFANGMKGDPYPVNYSITSFTDNTLPSMKSWSGTATNKPITRITEQYRGDVTFDFMGGKNNMDTPRAREALSVYPFSFEARWHSVEGAFGYLLDVFTLDVTGEDSIKTYVAGYRNFPVNDTSCIIHVPSEQSPYYYQVRSTNGFKESEYSVVISLTTTNSKPIVLPADDIRPFRFKANWEPLPWATGYYLTIFEIDSLPGGGTTETILPRYNNILTPDASFLVDEMDNERTYGYFIAATNGFATGVQSDVITLTTPPSTTSTYFVRNGYVYLKGIDPGSTVTLYGLDGLVKQTTNEPTINVAGKGLYIVEIQFKNTRKRIKVLVN